MTSSPAEPCPVDAVPGVLAAFAKAPLVALGEAHWLAEQAGFLARLMGHLAFPTVAGDIVVEFGNVRNQDLADAANRSEARQAALSVALDLVQLVRLRALPRRANSREFGELPQRGDYRVGCCRS